MQQPIRDLAARLIRRRPRLAAAALAAVVPLWFASPATAQQAATTDTLDTTLLDEVVVTGTRTEKLLAETPVRTEVIDRTRITATGARSLADAVEFTPGLRVLDNCQNCNFTTLSMLGLEGKYSQVLYDGQPIFSGLALVYGLEQIPARLIDRIEVVKGGGSAVYGPGAVGGVVNVIPRTPLASGGEASARIEDMDGTRLWSAGFNADVVSRDGRTALTVYGQADQWDPYDRNDDGFTDIGQRQSSALGARVVRQTGDRGELTVDFSRVFEDRRGGDQLDQPPFRAEIAEWVRSWRNTASASWDQRWSDRLNTRATLVYADTDRDTYYGGGGDPNAYGSTDNPLLVSDLQFDHVLGDHVLTWGVQYTREDMTDLHPAYDRVTEETYENTGVFVQDDWAVSDPLVLITGVRVDQHSLLDDPILSPRVAARYHLGRDVTLRASYSRGFLAPQIFDEDLHILIAGGAAQVIRNADDLEEEKSRSVAISLEATPRIGAGFGRLELNAFRTDLQDAFSLREDLDDPATPETEIVRINGGDAHVQGLEATAGWLDDVFEAQVGWVIQEGAFDQPQDFGETDFFRLPESYGVINVSYRDPATVDAFLGIRYLGEQKMPHYAGWIAEDRLEITDPFWVVDLSLARRLPIARDAVTLTLGARNLFDEYQDDLDVGPDRDSGYLYGPRFPRTFYATVGYDF